MDYRHLAVFISCFDIWGVAVFVSGVMSLQNNQDSSDYSITVFDLVHTWLSACQYISI